MNKHKKFVLLALISILVINIKVYGAGKSFYFADGKRIYSDSAPIRLVVNDNEISNLTTNPILYNNTLLVPLREAFEPLGGYIEYNKDRKDVSLVYNENLIIFKEDSNKIYVNEKEIIVNVSPKTIDNKFMIPLRFVTDNLNLETKWDSVNRIVIVKEKPVEIEKEKPVEIEKSNVVEEVPEKEIIVEEVPKSAPSEIKPEEIKTVNDNSIEVLNTESHQRTVVKGAIIPGQGEQQRFVIPATSPISSLKKGIESGNKLVFDIDNSDLNVSDYTQTVANNPNVSEIRYGNTDDGTTSVTRIVLELKPNVSFKVSYSNDRKNIYIDFEENKVQNVIFSKNGTEDIIKIINTIKTTPNIFYVVNPNKLIVDFNGSVTEKEIDEITSGLLVEKINVTNFAGNKVRLVIDMKEQGKYDVSQNGNETIISIKAPTFKNIDFDSENRRIVFKKIKGKEINLDGSFDDYNNNKYIFNVSTDLGNEYGYGTYYISDGFIDNITLENKDGKTKITVNEKQIMVCKLTEDKDNYYLEIRTPKEIYPLVIVLDPGHGAHDPGAAANGLREKDLNLDISLKIYNLIKENENIKAYLTRDSDTFRELSDRAEYGNATGDIFISVHNNAHPGSSSAQGTEVYFYPHSNDTELGFTSKQMADIMQRSLLTALGSVDRKVQSSGFAVIKRTKIPAVLLEIGFLTNKAEASLLATEEYRQKAAESVYKGILEVYDIYKPKR